MNLVIFESANWTSFAPLTLTRPVFCLASGGGSLLTRQLRQMRPRHVRLWVRPGLKEFCEQRVVPYLDLPATVNEPLDERPTMMLNGAAMASQRPEGALAGPYVERSAKGEVGFTFLTAPGLAHADILENSSRWQELTGLTTHECRQRIAGHVADLIHDNADLVKQDFEQVFEKGHLGMRVLPAGPFHSLNWERIRIGDEVKLAPGVVLDATAGPIIIERGAAIGANSVIEGPSYIGPQTTIRPLTLIRGGCSIGPVCRIGGEVEGSIIQGRSNKVHDGYLGHSFLGEWVNLGAGTTTSNLKNTYGPISLKVGERELPTGRIFMGSVIGDYTKAAIGTRLMSGTYVGVSSMIACSRHCPRFVGSFQFITDSKQEPYDFHKAVEVATRVYARRNRSWTGLDESLLHWAAESAAAVEFDAAAPAAV